MDTLTENGRFVTVQLKRYKQLVEDSLQLEHLNALGVDNWEGYSWYEGDEDDDES